MRASLFAPILEDAGPYVPVDNDLFVLDGREIEFPEGLRTGDYTHTIHRFPGKFVPQVARELIKLARVSGSEALIIDPFCGSGTTLIEAAVAGIGSLGLDLDPLGAMISRIKTTPLTHDDLGTLSSFWSASIGKERDNAVVPQIRNLGHWFSDEAIAELAFIKRRCLELPQTLRDFSLVIMSSIIRRVSKADDQTQKTYVSGTLPKTPPLPSALFPIFMSRALTGMGAFSKACLTRPMVRCADARNQLPFIVADAIVTSPPYLDSIDYVYNQLLEYYWMHDQLGLENEDDIRSLRKTPMGFARPDTGAALARLQVICPSLDLQLRPIVDEVNAVSRKEAEHIVGYFTDFVDHLRGARAALRPGKRYVVCVGESTVRGQRIRTPDFLALLFEGCGFRLVGRCSYAIKRHYMKFPRRSNSGTIRSDHILCFEAV